MSALDEKTQSLKAMDEAGRRTVQARGQGDDDAYFDGAFALDNILTLALPRLADGIPEWSIFPGARDRALRKFARTETILAGGLYSLVSQIKSLEWEIVADPDGGSPRKKKYAQDLLNDAEFGQGFPALAEKVAYDLETQDNGAFIELWGTGKPTRPLEGVNQIRGLAHLDSNQCLRTFDREFPVVYVNPLDNTKHKLHKSRVIMLSKNKVPQELARDIGFCSVSRVLKAARYMRNVLTYKDEKVAGRFTRAIGYGKGFTGPMLRESLSSAEKDDDARGLVMYRKIPFLLPPGQGIGDIELKLLDLASLQEGFNFESELTLYVYMLALAFGTDARDFWPATASGATKADASVQNMKARGKGKGDLIQMIERAINWRVLPDGVRFRYDFTDDDEDEQKARIHKTKSETFKLLADAGFITALEGRAQAVIAGVLDPSGLFEEGAIADAAEPASDTGDAVEGDDVTEAEQTPDEDNPNVSEEEDEEERRRRGQRIMTKAIQATRIDFEDALETVLLDASEKRINRRRAGSLARSALKRAINRAFIDGLNDGGVSTDVLADEDATTTATMYSTATDYLTGLLDDLYSEDGLSASQLAGKPSMWFNKSVYPAYLAGLSSATKNGMFEWVYGRTEEHCVDCARLAGQRHRMNTWQKRGLLPKSDALACGGFNCDCALVLTTEKARGRF